MLSGGASGISSGSTRPGSSLRWSEVSGALTGVSSTGKNPDPVGLSNPGTTGSAREGAAGGCGAAGGMTGGVRLTGGATARRKIDPDCPELELLSFSSPGLGGGIYGPRPGGRLYPNIFSRGGSGRISMSGCGRVPENACGGSTEGLSSGRMSGAVGAAGAASGDLLKTGVSDGAGVETGGGAAGGGVGAEGVKAGNAAGESPNSGCGTAGPLDISSFHARRPSTAWRLMTPGAPDGRAGRMFG
jgi:hypothetical protein